MNTSLRVATSVEDFRRLREKNFEYVDKTHLITEFIDRDNFNVILLPRPRRFGKSLNMSTLKWFFEKRDENVWHLFEGLHVARAGERYREHFQKYPVISISLKETKADSFDQCLARAKDNIQSMYKAHRAALEGKLDSLDAAKYQAVLEGTADKVGYVFALKHLTEWLHKAHGVRPIVLIDEYDAGIHAAHTNGFYKEAIGFFGSFFLAGLKDNVHLERGVMTGILRVSRESIFSDLNSVGIYSMLDRAFNTCFGFTESEVSALMEKAGFGDIMPEVRAYYDGYAFGGVEIYNPWSILSFLERNDGMLAPYWVGTSSNALIKELLQHHAFRIQDDIRTLLEGGSIEKAVDTNVVFPELKEDPNALWNLLVFTGYLKATAPPPGPHGTERPLFRLSIPNREVASVYRTTFQSWMSKGLTAHGGSIDALLNELLQGNVSEFEEQLQKFASSLPSYHDVKGAKPETFYHGMMIGLLASLEPAYEVRSNRESGQGRPDVLIKPRQTGKPGVVLELKSARKGVTTIEKAMADGLQQFEDNDYAAELRHAGVEKIQQMVVAFDGKRVMVLPKGAMPPRKKSATKKAKAAAKKKR